MLNYLYQQIAAISNIAVLSESTSGVFIEYYQDSLPSENQISQINTIISNWPLQKLKLEKIKILDNNWKQKIKIGWQTPTGYSLGIDISDVALLNGAFTLAKEANNIGIDDPASIVDIDGQSHTMNLDDFTLLMLAYGQARASLSNSYANLKRAINEASSIEELDAIDITL